MVRRITRPVQFAIPLRLSRFNGGRLLTSARRPILALAVRCPVPSARLVSGGCFPGSAGLHPCSAVWPAGGFVLVAGVLLVLLAGCRPMPQMGQESRPSSRGKQRQEFHEVEYTDKTPEEWLALLGHRDPQVRDQAIDALIQYGPGQVKALIPVVQDKQQSRARLSAIRALGALRKEAAEACPALVEALRDTSWDGRDAAAEALGVIGQNTPEVTAALLEALRDADPRLRMTAARALGRLRASDPAIVQALVDLLQDPELAVQVAAVEALGEIGPAAQAAVPRLQELTKTGPSLVQVSAQQALEQIQRR